MQRAFLWRTGAREHTVLSVEYHGGSDEFAWVIPTESRPLVEAEKGAPFTELRQLTKINVPTPTGGARHQTLRASGASAVTDVERKVEGPYDIAVLETTNGNELYLWLKQNGFHLSKDARAALDSYVVRKFSFVAARLRPGTLNKEVLAERHKQGTIAPLHFSFAARQLSDPLRVTAGNPGASRMDLYVFGDPIKPQELFTTTPIHLVAQGAAGYQLSGPRNLALSERNFPTLRRLLPARGTLTHFEATLVDAERQRDLVF